MFFFDNVVICVQFGLKFLYSVVLLCTWGCPPLYRQLRRFAQWTVPSHDSNIYSFPKPTRGIFLFFGLIYFELFAALYVQALAVPPEVDLTEGFGNYDMNWDNTTLHLNYQENGIVVYHAKLLRNHQLYGVSKVLDYTSLSLANDNAKNSLLKFTHPHHFEDFILLHDMEYYVSYEKMTLEQCYINCASKGSTVIGTEIDFYRVQKEFSFDSIWVDTTTTAIKQSSNMIYSLFLGATEIFPVNLLTRKGQARIFYQHEGAMVEIDKISTFYKGYYDSQSQEYYVQSSYNLKAAISKQGELNVFIPTQHNVLQTDASHCNCGCNRLPSMSRRVAHSVRNSFHRLQVQTIHMNMSIETRRLKRSRNNGNVYSLLQPRSVKQRSSNQVAKTYHIEEISPLNVDLPNVTNSQFVFAPATIATFAVKAVGVPLMQKAFLAYMRKFGKEIGAKFKPFTQKSSFLLPREVEVTGLTSTLSNFSLIITFEQLSSFETNISMSSSLELTDQLLKNLSMTNDQFISFLKTQAVDYMLTLAAQDMSLEIDQSLPVLVVAHPSNSFVKFDFYIPCWDSIPSVTEYSLMPLPHMSVSQQLKGLKLPTMVSTEATNFHFIYPNGENEPKTLSDCLNGILAGTILSSCIQQDYPHHRIHKGLNLGYLYIYSLYAPEPESSHIKISCPGRKQFNLRSPFQITVLAMSPLCNLGLTTDHGTISVQGNKTFSGYVHDPKLLFGYNVSDYNNMTYNHTLIIIAIVSVLVLLIAIVTIVLVYIFIYRVESITETYTQYDSDETIHNMTTDSSIRGVTFAQTNL